MPAHRRLRAPAANREVLAEPGFDAIPQLVETNRRRLDRSDVRIDGLSLRELRAIAREEIMALAHGPRKIDGPLLLAGHQPELSHPGVWIKNFALNGLAKKLGAIPLHLVVDSDTVKSTTIRLPVFRDRDPESVHLESIPFDAITGKPTYEEYEIQNAAVLRDFLPKLAERTRNWSFRPLALEAWGRVAPPARQGPAEQLRTHYERLWGCRNYELPVSAIVATQAFRHFVRHIARDQMRFRDSYNRAIREYRRANGVRSKTHPAPELGPDELPFWEHTPSGRQKHAGEFPSEAGQIRPRALTLTLFARLCLGDLFIHGIGGGKYDEATDAIIRDYLAIEPPAYQVLSATLHLPLEGFAATTADRERAERLVRDLYWNPQRHVTALGANDPNVLRLVADRISQASNEPSFSDRPARREWFHRLQEMNEQLRPLVAASLPAAQAAWERACAEVRANAILERRDYAWILFPEETLRPFLQQFLEV
jgi:hypothetical protein